jgi:hypothetical protein
MQIINDLNRIKARLIREIAMAELVGQGIRVRDLVSDLYGGAADDSVSGLASWIGIVAHIPGTTGLTLEDEDGYETEADLKDLGVDVLLDLYKNLRG